MNVAPLPASHRLRMLFRITFSYFRIHRTHTRTPSLAQTDDLPIAWFFFSPLIFECLIADVLSVLFIGGVIILDELISVYSLYTLGLIYIESELVDTALIISDF